MYVNFRGPRRIQGFLGEGFCWNNDLPFANKPQIAQLSKLLDGEKAFTSGRAQLDFWGGLDEGEGEDVFLSGGCGCRDAGSTITTNRYHG